MRRDLKPGEPSVRAPLSRLDAVFRPKSVCLVGVSADPHRLNHSPFPILMMNGFEGDIHLVNPKYREILGHPCVARIEDVPNGVDLAIIMVPASEVPDVLEACCDKGMRAAIVLSSGFEEVQGGEALVARIKHTCAERGLALIGPNCEGVWSVAAKAILTFGSAAKREKLTHAPVAIVSQSGAMSGAIARHLQDLDYGCSYVVSVGNETDTTLLEVTDWLLDQTDVKHVLMFMEGLRDGWRLGSVAAKARARGIDLIALKSGNTTVGAEAAASHTGKIATPYAIYRDVFAQHDVVQVDTLVDLVEIAQVLLSAPPVRSARAPASAGLTICSLPGGTRALTADLCGTQGVPLSTFTETTVTRLTELLPRFGYVRNPVDLTGQILSRPHMLNDALVIVAQDPNTQALVVQFANRGMSDVREREKELGDIARQYRIPVIVSLLADEMPASERRRYAADGLLVARDPREAVRWLSWLYRLHAAATRTAPAAAAAESDGAIMPPEQSWNGIARFLGEVGIAVPRWVSLKPEQAAASACAELRYPVVVKALPEDVEHKTELGALVLNVRDAAAVDREAARLRERIGKPRCDLLVQEMIADGVEVTLAAMRNPDFGSVLAIGSGGVMVELMNDMTYLALPATEAQIEAAIDRLLLSRLLAGFRGAPAADRGALARAAFDLGQAFLRLPPSIQEVELNPVLVRPAGAGVVAIDALVRVQ